MKNLLLKLFAIILLAGFFHACNETLIEEQQPVDDLELKSAGIENGLVQQINPLSIPDDERFLVGFASTPDVNLIKSVGGSPYRTFSIVPAIAARLNPKAVEALSKNPKIKYIEPDYKVFATDQSVPWGISRVFGDETYQFKTWTFSTGTGRKVAILDTGIDTNHEDLPSVLGGTNTLDGSNNFEDGNGHGTHVSGTVAALDNDMGVVGVTKDVDLYAVKVLDDSGGGTVSSVAGGIEWAKDYGMHIINMSLGSSSSSTTLENACNEAYNAGVLIVSSAGNSGNPGGGGNNVGYPGAYESVIAVAASTQNNTRASFSSTGPAVELIAPGLDVLSTIPDNDYDIFSGTSMASPHVTGVSALTWAANTTLSNVEVRMILRETAEDLGMSAEHQGYGLARADLAVKEAEGTEPVLTGNIKGTVTDSDGTIEGATVVVEGTSLSATTEPDGSYLLENVPAGDQEVTASADGYYPETAIVTVEEDVTVTQDFVLQAIPTYTVSGMVTDGEGYDLHLEGATVAIEETGQSATTDSDGNYSIADVEKGTYNITASKSGYSSKTKTVTVNNNTAVDFVLEEETEELLSIVIFEVTDSSNPAWARVTVDWAVSGSNLASVKSEMFLGDERIDSETSSVSGSDASGTHDLRNRGGHDQTYDITLTVTDADGNEASETKTIGL